MLPSRPQSIAPPRGPVVTPADVTLALFCVPLFLTGFAIDVAGASFNPTIPQSFYRGGGTGAAFGVAMATLHFFAVFRYRALLLLLLVIHTIFTALRLSAPVGNPIAYGALEWTSHVASMAIIVFLCLRLGGFWGAFPKDGEGEI